MSKVIFSKYSNDRADEFSIYTNIVKLNDGTIKVRKNGAGVKAKKHIYDILKWSELLKKQYSGSKLEVCENVENEEMAECDFIEGKTLEEIMDLYISTNEINKAKQLLHTYIQLILEYNTTKEFEMTDAFRNVFGDITFEKKMKTADVNDIDMVLNNVIVSDNSWKLIDYEWTFEFPIPVDFIIYRILHYYFETNNSRNVLKDENYLNISDFDLENFRKMEISFQNYVKGNKHPIRELYNDIGKKTINVVGLMENLHKDVKIYEDLGEGYSEEHTFTIRKFPHKNNCYRVNFMLKPGVKKYRIDPCEEDCTLQMISVIGNGRYEMPFQTNGFELGKGIYVCNADPWIEIDVQDTIIEELSVEFQMEYVAPGYMNRLVESQNIARQKEIELQDLSMQNASLNQQLIDANVRIQNLNREKEILLVSRSWRLTEPLRKLKVKTKRILKSNKVTHTICRKTKAIIRGTNKPQPLKEEEPIIVKEIPSVSEIVDIMCPKEQFDQERNTKFSEDITFSILVPLYNTPKRFLCEMIESVQYQTYEKWELCLADGSDEEHSEVGDICRAYAANDNRIKYKELEENKGISGNTNACIDMATGNYIALFDHDDFLHPSVLFENMKAICEHHADYIYTDEATFEGTNIFNIITRHCKPDYAIDNLRANNYICHFSVFKKTLLDKAGRFRSEYDGSQDHDLILRLTDQAEKVFHIRKILYFWRSHPNSVASNISAKTYAIDAAKRAVESHLSDAGIKAEIESSKAFPTIFRIKYELLAKPKVSILIPNKDHIADLKKCLQSINKSTYQNYEIIIIENNSYKNSTFRYYEELKNDTRIKVVKYDGEFNYSKINNYGVQFTTGEYLLFLNNDTEVINNDWIEELLMYAQRKDVAAVGAKLYYDDDTIQHAGIVIGLGADRAAGHSHYRVPRENVGYMGRLYYAQDVSAVTAACMMVKKSIYDELHGLDENFVVAFNDVDFCLKAREKGYLNVFTPYCELYHYESKSRGFEDTPKKQERFQKEVAMFKKKWAKVLLDGDPYYNPNFSLDRGDFYVEPEEYLKRAKAKEELKEKERKAKESEAKAKAEVD